MKTKHPPIDPSLKKCLGYPKDESDEIVLKKWKAASRIVCKPCWEIKYCPYGILVEDFPILPPTRAQAIEQNEYLKKCLETNTLASGEVLDDLRREWFEDQVSKFRKNRYPESIPQEFTDMTCTAYGHICPVVFVFEDGTETPDHRRVSRYISFKTKVRVIRRDNYTCQHCSKHLRDNEVEFDHIIPIAKGGSSEEHNIRLTCFACNRDKSDKIEH
jgi:HNH endonuclease